jgi:RNA polymerase sigma-70 factor (ECF subfamily)
LNRGRVEQACVDFEADLRAFLAGVLRDSHLVDDAFQRTVLKAIQASESVRLETLRGWLFQIALNEARELRRLQKRGQDLLQKAVWLGWSEAAVGMSAGSDGLIEEERRQVLQRAIRQLPAELQEIVIRRISGNQTFAQIAEELGCPLGTVLGRMQRAVKQLSDCPELRSLENE